MLTPDHELAERLAAQAEMILRQGDTARARGVYAEAAAAEQRAAAAFAAQKKMRTFSILAVSHASLLYKAKQLDPAEQWTCAYLAHPSLNEWGRFKMRELLEVIWDEQTIERHGLEYSGEEIWIALRGGEVGSGTAPVEVALHYMNSANQLVYRAVEWTAKFGFRRRGAAPPPVLQALQARATQPVPGSYRFSVRLLKPEQMQLFPGEQPQDRIEPAAVATFVVDFLRAASGKRGEDIEDVVPDREYRQALLQLARNLLPRDPLVVREIEVLRVSHGHAESALLLPGAREPISAAIRKARPPQPADADRENGQLAGTLRALHLDKKWLEIHLEGGGAQRCETPEDVLDDVVGPMVNKNVKITGYWSRKRGNRRFFLDDIELA